MSCNTEADLGNMPLNNLADFNEVDSSKTQSSRRRQTMARRATHAPSHSSRSTGSPLSTVGSGSIKTSNSYR